MNKDLTFISDPQSSQNYFPGHLMDQADEYFRWSPTGNWTPPKTGFKFHISCQQSDAETVAELVTLAFRASRVHHKLLPNMNTFQKNAAGPNKGKFIVAYLPAPNAQAIQMIDGWMRSEKIAPGPVPRIRLAGNSYGGPETLIGHNVYRRAYSPEHQ